MPNEGLQLEIGSQGIKRGEMRSRRKPSERKDNPKLPNGEGSLIGNSRDEDGKPCHQLLVAEGQNEAGDGVLPGVGAGLELDLGQVFFQGRPDAHPALECLTMKPCPFDDGSIKVSHVLVAEGPRKITGKDCKDSEAG